MSAKELCDLMLKQFTTMSYDGVTGASMTWSADGTVTKAPKAVVIQNGAYVGLD